MIISQSLLRWVVMFLVMTTVLQCVHAWTQGDFEIFDLVDEIEKSEGKGVNFYSWLNISPTASQADIGRAYRKISLKLHPDKNKNDPKAKERFARLGKVSAILRDKSARERYNFFYKNGVPRWRGSGYYYSRFRPGVGSVIALLSVIAGLMQYVAQRINCYQEKQKIQRFIQDARANLSLSVPKNYGAPTLGKSYVEVGGRSLRCDVKSDTYIVVYPEGDDAEPVHLNLEWVQSPSVTSIFLIQWPKRLVRRLLGIKDPEPLNTSGDEDEDEDEEEDEEEETEKDTVKKDQPKPESKSTKKSKKSKGGNKNATATGSASAATKVGGRRRVTKK